MAHAHDDPLSKLIRSAGRREPVPADAQARVRAAVRAEWKGVVRRRNARRWGVWLGSTVAAGVMVGLLLAHFRSTPDTSIASVGFIEGRPFADSTVLAVGTRVNKGAVIATGKKDRVALSLPGGQSLRLDRNSRVRLLSESVAVLEAGALYGDSPSEESSLEIRTDVGVVRDIGTQFEVRKQDGAIRVRVREGSITLEQGAQKSEAKAGEQLSAAPGSAPMKSEVPLDHPDWQWASACAPALDLEGATLAEFLKWAAREQGLKVEYANPAAADSASKIRLSGSTEGMTPQEALDAFLPASNANYHVRAGVLTVSVER
ncbi:MAG TPA: FecR family protein [Planctomycetota bacterium]|nr:FecR family protein [Planctomycetota bacterium]